MDGIVVSNHGGRQVDGTVAALDTLPSVAEAVTSQMPVLFDNGIRTGADVVKALPLGSRAVLLGRPHVTGWRWIEKRRSRRDPQIWRPSST